MIDGCVRIGRAIRPLWAWFGRLVAHLLAGRGYRADALANPSIAGMRRLALAGVIVNIGIIVSGGLVRVSESGLGCPTWPRCTGDSLLPTAQERTTWVHTAIEFGNRMLTYVLLAVAVAVFVGALAWRPRRPDYARLAVVQPLGVLAQAILGGITVLTGLHPGFVGLHYLLSAAVVAACVLLWRATIVDGPPAPDGSLSVGSAGDAPDHDAPAEVEPSGSSRAAAAVSPSGALRTVAWLLVVSAGLLLVAGTVATGAGPHAGDASAERYRFLDDRTIEWTTRTHAALAWVTVAAAVAAAVLVSRRGDRSPRRSIEWVLVLLVGQGVVGYVQYAAGVPAPLVIVHMLGSALAWSAVVWFAADVLSRWSVRAGRPSDP